MRRWIGLGLALAWTGCRCDASPSADASPAATTASSPPPGAWVDLALAPTHACAVRRDGALFCWGQVPAGAGFSGTLVAPQRATLPGPVERVVAAGEAICTLGSGTVRCWGDLHAATRWAEPTVIEGLAGATDLALGADHLCAVVDRHVRCLGSNAYGQLGDGSTTARDGIVEVRGLDVVTNVLAGDHFACAHRSELTVFCWGRGDRGQLGQGRAESASLAVGVEGLTEVTAVAAGPSTSCARRREGTVVCWGQHAGDLIDDRRIDESRQILQNGARNLHGLAVAGPTACGIGEDGLAICWGEGSNGLLGRDLPASKRRWQGPGRVDGIEGIRLLAAGPTAFCATTEDAVWCWGSAAHGILGNGSRRHHHEAVEVSGIGDAVAIAVGDGWSCARRRGGALACWGAETPGAGERSYEPRPTAKLPAEQPFGTRAASGGPLNGVRCAIDDEVLRCEGDGPLALTSLPHVTAVAMASAHACALRTDGHVVCWGDDLRDAVGSHHAAIAPLPTRVSLP